MKLAILNAMILIAFVPTALAQKQTPLDQEAADATTAAASADRTGAEPSVAIPNRWLLLCCGLPGDAEHRDRLTAACEKIIAAAQPILGVPPEQLLVLGGDDEMRDALSQGSKDVGVCTAESIAEAMKQLSDTVQPDDACWVVLLGHAHLYNNKSQLNVLDADFDQSQFALWAKPLACREQVFWLTMPISGFWIKPLSSPGRVIISATEADLEFTGTEMPYALADVLSGDGQEHSLRDVDQDGTLSLLDLYLATNLEVSGRFRSMDRLQTEHAQLEDNGDGRGSEVQEPYLPVEEPQAFEDAADADEDEPDSQESVDKPDEKQAVPEPISSKSLDGFLSRQILLKATDL